MRANLWDVAVTATGAPVVVTFSIRHQISSEKQWNGAKNIFRIDSLKYFVFPFPGRQTLVE